MDQNISRERKIMTTTGSPTRIAMGCFGVEGSEEYLEEFVRDRDVLSIGAGIPGFALKMYDHLHEQGRIGNTNINSLDKIYSQANPVMLRRIEEEFSVYSGEVALLVRSKMICGDWDYLPSKKNSMDLIIASGSYLYYPDTYTPGNMLSILNLLKPGGEFRIQLAAMYEDVYNALDFLQQQETFTAELMHNPKAAWVDKEKNEMKPQYLYVLVKRNA